VDFGAAFEYSIDGFEGAHAVFLGGVVGAGGIGINDGGEADEVPLLLELVIDAGVVASEGAYTYDGYVDGSVGWQKKDLTTEGTKAHRGENLAADLRGGTGMANAAADYTD
jgi:hypothetical protein